MFFYEESVSTFWAYGCFFCFFVFIPAVTFDLTRLVNKSFALHLLAVYEIDSVLEIGKNTRKENSIEKGYEEFMKNNVYIDQDDYVVVLYSSDHDDVKKKM